MDILEDSTLLDQPDHVLATLDLVVGAVHNHFSLSRKKQTAGILRAMESRYFSILAHPSGSLLGEREGYDIDMRRGIDKAHEHGCCLELNGHPKGLHVIDMYCQMARDVRCADEHRQ